MHIVVRLESCTGCGVCLESCPYAAIEMRESRAVITEYCQDCGVCLGVCPEGAIVRTTGNAKES